MSRSSSPTSYQNGNLTKLKNELERIRPYLQHKEFLARDINRDSSKHDVKLLSGCGAVEPAGTEIIISKRGKERPRTMWKWNEEVRQKLLEYDQERTEMPECNHRVHVFNPEWADELACKECGKEYRKDRIKELL